MRHCKHFTFHQFTVEIQFKISNAAHTPPRLMMLIIISLFQVAWDAKNPSAVGLSAVAHQWLVFFFLNFFL
jgi:hypothetical protein